MKNHFDNLLISVPSLLSREILDLGSGTGGFLIECARRGCRVSGIELNQNKVDESKERINKLGLDVDVKQGEAENLPYSDFSFDFINVAEVIEHVRDPEKVLSEMYRVMMFDSSAYVSVHNRYGMYDTHFHVYFLGWMPRFFREKYLTLLNKDKDYENMPDMQRIGEMHYYIFSNFKKLSEKVGFDVIDIREDKIKSRFGKYNFVFIILYKLLLRPFYFSTFHILLRK